MKFSLLPKMLLCLGLSGVFAVAQETVESVRRQIKAVEAETAREKSMHEAEKKRHAEFVEVGRKKVQNLSAQKLYVLQWNRAKSPRLAMQVMFEF